jgi:hypothetical protein
VGLALRWYARHSTRVSTTLRSWHRASWVPLVLRTDSAHLARHPVGALAHIVLRRPFTLLGVSCLVGWWLSTTYGPTPYTGDLPVAVIWAIYLSRLSGRFTCRGYLGDLPVAVIWAIYLSRCWHWHGFRLGPCCVCGRRRAPVPTL